MTEEELVQQFNYFGVGTPVVVTSRIGEQEIRVQTVMTAPAFVSERDDRGYVLVAGAYNHHCYVPARSVKLAQRDAKVHYGDLSPVFSCTRDDVRVSVDATQHGQTWHAILTISVRDSGSSVSAPAAWTWDRKFSCMAQEFDSYDELASWACKAVGAVEDAIPFLFMCGSAAARKAVEAEERRTEQLIAVHLHRSRPMSAERWNQLFPVGTRVMLSTDMTKGRTTSAAKGKTLSSNSKPSSCAIRLPVEMRDLADRVRAEIRSTREAMTHAEADRDTRDVASVDHVYVWLDSAAKAEPVPLELVIPVLDVEES